MMNNICDEYNPNCLVRSCCSQICDKIKNLVDGYIKYNLDNQWIFYELFTNEKCPVCHTNKFWFLEYSSPRTAEGIRIKITCDFCYATYRLGTHGLGDGKKAPSKLLQSYQGSIVSQKQHSLNIQKIKQYLLGELEI